MLVTRNVWAVGYRRMNGDENTAWIAVDTVEQAMEYVKHDIIIQCITSVNAVTSEFGIPVKVHIPAEFVSLPPYEERIEP